MLAKRRKTIESVYGYIGRDAIRKRERRSRKGYERGEASWREFLYVFAHGK